MSRQNPYTDDSFLSTSLDMPQMVDSLISKAYDRAKEFVRTKPDEIVEQVTSREAMLLDNIEELKRKNIYLQSIIKLKDQEIGELVNILKTVTGDD